MSLRICMYCGEPIAEKDNSLFRYPNLCASCSSLSDGMPESNLSNFPNFDVNTLVDVDFHPAAGEPLKASAHG